MKKSFLILGISVPLALMPAIVRAQSDGLPEFFDKIANLGQPKAVEEDREQVNQAMDSAIINPGQTVTWDNPTSGGSGTVIVSTSFKNSDGYNCRNYSRTTTSRQVETAHQGTVCKQLMFGWTVWNEKAISAHPVARQGKTTKSQTTQTVLRSDAQPVLSASPAVQFDREVMESQKLLTLLGYEPGPKDGLFGIRTRTAIENYQRVSNLLVDGRVSPTLMAALQAARKRHARRPNPVPGFEKGLAAYNRQNYQVAMRDLRPLAEQGVADAQHYVGIMHGVGLGVPTDHDEGTKWLRLAANQDHAESQYSLGITYLKGIVAKQDYAAAEKWFRKAAERGEVNSQYELAQIFHNGDGFPQDYLEAAKWYKRAAALGYVEAQYKLGSMFGRGEGVPQNDIEAVKWWRLAADKGHVPSQRNLGFMYMKGKGVPRDYVQAYVWLSLVASPRDPAAADGLDQIAQNMTPVEIAEAERVAREWLEAHPE